MTLPFHRRHDDEASHERARSLASTALVEPLGAGDAAWLKGHLARCPDCRAERDAYLADRVLLRGLRDRVPEPPRDLWARTAAAIEADGKPGRGRLGSLGLALPRLGPRGIPLGVLASALVVAVVVGTTLLRPGTPIVPPPSAGSSEGPRSSSQPIATPLVPVADRVAWIERQPDGGFSLVFANVDHACPDADPTCAPLADSSPAPLALAAAPQAVVLSPGNDQIAVVGSDTETAGSVLIVDVSLPRPTGSPSASPSSTPATPAPTVVVTPGASASTSPGNVRAIISGVVVVGSVSYSADGGWLAFSARPRSGPGGPNLYVWHPGDAEARQVTTDGETFFSGWYGDEILASSIVAEPSGDPASPTPGASPEPSAAASAEPSVAASEAPGESSAPYESGASPTPTPVEAHPYSFLLDPATGVRTTFTAPDVWLPSIDPTGRFITYWSGTVAPVDTSVTGPFAFGQVEAWRPATGRLVLDGWSAPLAPVPTATPAGSEQPAMSESPTSEPPTTEPPSETPTSSPEVPSDSVAPPSGSPGTASAAPSVGPAGTPVELAAGPIADFDARFDPTGSRLAIWVLDSTDSSAGRLWLVVLDRAAGAVDEHLQPMAAPGVQALRGFTINTGRLAWATPAGQDGQPSSVQVLAWIGDEFGQVQSVPGGNPQIVR